MSTIPSYIHMFPEPAEVFADRVEEHAKFLFPVFSVDLNQISPEWAGKVHMLQVHSEV